MSQQQKSQPPRLHGAPNFRDIGGYMLGDGRKVRYGRAYRSSQLSQLTAEDFAVLRQLGIAAVIDLRSELETKANPTPWPEGFGIESILPDIQVAQRAANHKMKLVLEKEPTPAGMYKMVDVVYQDSPVTCGPAFKHLADWLLASEAPIIFHCTNGRDRTGILAAVLQHLLGVSRADVLADYMRTNELLDIEGGLELNRRVLSATFGFDVSVEMVRIMNTAYEKNIDTLFDSLTTKYGSVEGYAQAFGVDARQQEKLREALLEAA